MWAKILETLVEDTALNGLMTDASHVKVHPDAADERGRNQEIASQSSFQINNKL